MKVLAVDSNSLLNRAYYGIRLLSTKDGVYTNGIYGFLNIMLKLMADLEPDAVAFAFDLPAPTFRHQVFEEYKGHRKPMPEELAGQFPLLKDILRCWGYPVVECEGYEADDILGTLAKACTDQGHTCVIATGDKDSLQLIEAGAQVLLATTKQGKADYTLYSTDMVKEKYGVLPRQLIDVKALMGDSSDNIPGVAGIGEKTALALIAEFESLEGVYEHLDSPSIKKGARAKLEAGREMAFISRNLATIETNAPVSHAVTDYQKGPSNHAGLLALLRKLELNTLTERMVDREEAAKQEEMPAELPTGCDVENSVKYVDNCNSLELAQVIRTQNSLGLLADFAGTELVRYVVVTPDVFYRMDAESTGFSHALELIMADFADKTWVCNAKPLYAWMLARGKEPGVFAYSLDLAAYVLNASAKEYRLDLLCAEYGVPFDEGRRDNQTDFAPSFFALCERTRAKIQENQQQRLLTEIEDPLCLVLASMEREGFGIDVAKLRQFGDEIGRDVKTLETQIFEQAGREFNILSPKQLGEILFDELGLPCKKKTKTGYSTNVDVMMAIRELHPIVDMVLEYRKLTKLVSTYVEGLLKVAGTDGRIHSTFNQTETRTGRISSAEPNMQNIPIRTELGRNMRKFFVAGTGKVLVDADYSQIELRVLAHIAQDKAMIQAFAEGEDIHLNTAAQVFGMPKDMVTPLMRSRAKAVNFGIVYGIGAYSLSEDIGVTVSEADTYIQNYLATYSGVRRYMEEVVKTGTEKGYVKTMFDRIRYVPELAAKNKILQGFGKRVAMNTPIQGTAADIIKIAMIRVYNRLRREGLPARLILQVHDELIVEADRSCEERVTKLLKEEMEQAVTLCVPLEVDVGAGESWYQAKA